MQNQQNHIRLPSMPQVFACLAIFLALAFSFTSVLDLPIQLALFIAWFVIMGLGIRLGHDYKSLEQAAVDGVAKGMGAILILVSVGALVGTWIAGGIVPSIIYFGLKVIHPSIFLLATLIICSLTSLATGTSWGSAATAGIAMMGIGHSLGVPAPLVAGAVLSGVYFGDKLSPLSDSVVLASTMSNVDVVEHIKGMLPISLFSYVITAALFTVVGMQYSGNVSLEQVNLVMEALDKQFNITPLAIVPVVLVLGLLANRKPAFPVISFGALLGLVWAIAFQGMDPIKAMHAAYSPFPIVSGVDFIDNILGRGGMESMLGSVAVIIFGLGFGGLLEKVGILAVIASAFEKRINGAGSLTTHTIGTAFLANVFGSAMYVSLILTPKIMAKNYDRLGLARKNLSRNAEFGGTLTCGMVPWSDNGIFMAGVLGVATLDYLPYMWLSFTCIIVTITLAYLGKGVNRLPVIEAASSR
ncbi:Na+/H+ antiporter NhaC [Aeromonas hydrophila]|uniref:Na+/H+ antiporter NhaC n=1 Tax=Aeromonas hydrophila TaxID=644 RepID=UPI00209E2A00|nr:Na+/H+ antiporter NhaC [Aeromonas hydrophila]MCP1267800.1 Na+/H+ antiporter NhaC [Aeromonas hydrophila]MCP1295737.1 Na+/H+ antiporter NhaC [Aeromonas hydrophila]